MAVDITGNPGEFRSRVEDWLAERPVENNVLVTVAAQELDGVFAWVEEDDAIRAAALRTPPHPLVTSALDARDADPLMAVLLEADPDLSGVTGPEPSALFMAEAWRARTGGSFSPRLEMALYALDEVVPPARPPTGGPRLADARERELLI